jgi:aspartyl-tRNA(Asn)/glutamyl-tRNA(Gln) amidotransferase subunit A
MQATELLDADLAEVATRLRRRELSPVELTTVALARIDRVEPGLHAFVTVMAGEARAAARAAEQEIGAGRYRGPLHGVPIGVKDLCETAGVPTTAGSSFLARWIPDRDAAVVRRLREAGAVIIGKLNLHEFAFGATGINPHAGTARNPWDPDRVTGGSSSGSGAAVAAGTCFAALGSDTGGSIRIPASLCGVVGIKPTHGRVSLRGVVPLAPSLDTVGPMARSVRDAALLLQAIAGHDPEDPWSVDVPVGDYSAHLDAGVAGIRVGVPSEYAFDGCEPEVAAAAARAVAVLESLGARRVEVKGDALGLWWIANMDVLLAEAADFHRQRYEVHATGFGEDVRGILAAALALPASQRASAARLRDALRRGEAEERLFVAADVLLMPATPVVAPRVADVAPADPLASLTHNTAPFNLAGLPALSIPCGVTTTGLPIGLQIVGRHWDEATLLRVAAAYEAARGAMPRPRGVR